MIERWVTRCKIELMSKVIEEVTLFAQVRHVVDLQCRIHDVCETVEGKP